MQSRWRSRGRGMPSIPWAAGRRRIGDDQAKHAPRVQPKSIGVAGSAGMPPQSPRPRDEGPRRTEAYRARGVRGCKAKAHVEYRVKPGQQEHRHAGRLIRVRWVFCKPIDLGHLDSLRLHTEQKEVSLQSPRSEVVAHACWGAAFNWVGQPIEFAGETHDLQERAPAFENGFSERC